MKTQISESLVKEIYGTVVHWRVCRVFLMVEKPLQASIYRRTLFVFLRANILGRPFHILNTTFAVISEL